MPGFRTPVTGLAVLVSVLAARSEDASPATFTTGRHSVSRILVRSLEGQKGEEVDWVGGLHENASGILGDLRRVARDQRPTLLDDLGIVAALEWLITDSESCSDLSRTTGPLPTGRSSGAETQITARRPG